MILEILAIFGLLWNAQLNCNHIFTAHRQESAGVFLSNRVTFLLLPTHIGRERRGDVWTQKPLALAYNYTECGVK